MKKLNWMVLNGEASIEENNLKFDWREENKFTCIRSNQFLKEGSLSFRIKLIPSEEAEFPLVFNVNMHQDKKRTSMRYGITSHREFFIIKDDRLGINRLDSTGADPSLKGIQEYEVKITIRGSRAIVFSNGVEVCQTDEIEVGNSQVSIVMEGMGSMEITDFEVFSEPLKALTFFGTEEEYNYIFDNVLTPVCNENGYKMERIEQYAFVGKELVNMLDNIRASDMIVFDGNAPSSYFTFLSGYALALGKEPVFLLNDKKDQQCDLSPFHVITYSDVKKDMGIIMAKLLNMFQTLNNERNPDQVRENM